MTPVRRLAIAGTGAAAGAAIAVAGSRATWRTITMPASGDVTAGALGTVHLPSSVVHARAADVPGAGAVPMLALLALVGCVLVFLVGPRARVALLCGVIGLSAWTAWLAFDHGRGPFPATPGVSATAGGPGPWLTMAGAVVTGLGAILALGPARRVTRLRMPESGPDAGGFPRD